MKKNNKRLDGKKMCLALTRKMEADMRSFCRDKGIESENELVRQAIVKYIYADYQDETLKLQGIKKLEEKLTELRDMVNITFSYLRLSHINNLAYHPELGERNADAAFSSANNRHDKFFDVFQDSLKNDPPFFERLLHKYYSGDFSGQD
jgi:hypothetical protein